MVMVNGCILEQYMQAQLKHGLTMLTFSSNFRGEGAFYRRGSVENISMNTTARVSENFCILHDSGVIHHLKSMFHANDAR